MRNECFDILKGVGILAVILGHSLIPNYFRNFIFAWHMPLFFMISGYFYKPSSLTLSIKKNLRGLIVPYIFTAIALFIFTVVSVNIGYKEPKWYEEVVNSLVAIVYGAGSQDLPNGGNYYVGAIWFLLALFWCRITFNLIYTQLRKYYILITIAISLVSTILAHYIFVPLDILQGFSALLFFLVGFLAKEKGFLKSEISFLLVITTFVLLLLSAMMGPVGMVTCYYPAFMLNVIAAIGGGILFYHLSSKLVGKKIGILLAYIGKLSLIVLCIHILDLRFISRCYYYISSKLMINDMFHNRLLIMWHLIVPVIGSILMSRYRVFQRIFNLR